jgi:hypothetical protein
MDRPTYVYSGANLPHIHYVEIFPKNPHKRKSLERLMSYTSMWNIGGTNPPSSSEDFDFSTLRRLTPAFGRPILE